MLLCILYYFVSRPLMAGLRQCDTGRRFITSLVMAAVSDEHRCSAYFFLIKVPHITPLLHQLAEGSRANCIQICSPRVQVSSRLCTCISYRRALSGQMSRLVSDFVPVHLLSVTELFRLPLLGSGTVCLILSLPHLP